ncbi:modular serine protease isoform X2 [Nilaparvata lugens]|uniref:Clotting factor C n=1 Tax=Nilaparvata lugens TaxID=108931 RepID=A0A068F581_NILLU|nr:modular serine protease isoform X2 [Nilaparvata lugens]AID60283.1 clotting factor C [Nilaparvata lugens]
MRFTLAIIYFILLKTVVGEGNDFYCLDGSAIPYDNICDGKAQCDDQSDEDEDICSTDEDEFECYDGQKIAKQAVCNGTAECSDETDESIEKCALKQCEGKMFRCSYGACIDSKLVCDKKNDCLDGSDEEGGICSDDNKCEIPHQPAHTTFEISDCVNCTPGATVKSGTRIKITCGHGYMLHSKYSEASCSSGKWIPEVAECYHHNIHLLSKRAIFKEHCSPIMVEAGADVHCTKGGKEITCKFPLPAGSIAKMTCHNYYSIEGTSHAECLPNGKWSRHLKCSSSCYKGIDVALIVRGQLAQSAEFFPWVAALYAVENDQWTYRCGGTLISDRAMITAAHCVWKLTGSDFKVTLGKKYRDFYNTEEHQQNFNIERVKLLSVYQDSNGNYGSDLAILIFKEIAQLSVAIHPACIQWDEDYSDNITLPGNKGLVAGWGLTEEDKPSDVLRYISIPIIKTSQCISKEPDDFRKFITYTSFCAGYNNGTSVCNGDSGSGLLLPDKGALYLEGIVSVSPRRTNSFSCQPKLYTVFTKVNAYKKWIQQILDESEEPHHFT